MGDVDGRTVGWMHVCEGLPQSHVLCAVYLRVSSTVIHSSECVVHRKHRHIFSRVRVGFALVLADHVFFEEYTPYSDFVVLSWRYD